jgi:hypothetical protein
VEPRARASLLWGLIGALGFLVLLQGYRLLTGEGVTVAATVGVALLVGLGAGAATYAIEGRLDAKEQS